jgi:hypothetical protein
MHDFQAASVADQMRFWRDPAKRAGTLRQRLGLIVRGKRISCPPQMVHQITMTIHRITITNNLCFSFALEDLARKWTTSESQEECGKRVEKQPKNRPPPTPTGMKGGCSPQNNL